MSDRRASSASAGPASSEKPYAAGLKAVLCSAIGVAVFLVPVSHDGSTTIVLGILSSELSDGIGSNMRLFTLPVFLAGALVAALYNLTPHRLAHRLPLADRLIADHWLWTVLSLFGGLVAGLTLLQLGPDWMVGKSTGVTAYVDVAGAIFLIIGLGCLFLPFLTDYGLLEFVGVLLRAPFQRLFRLPGRATVDTLASWVGASSIAVIMTGRQYDQGYYTAREAAVIATNFSVVSMPFVFLTAQVAGIPDHFFALYGSMLLVCLVCALLTPMLPPLSRVPDHYIDGGAGKLQEDVPPGIGPTRWAFVAALDAAAAAPHPLQSLRRGLLSMAELFLTLMPAAMTIEFLALVAYEHTPLFHWLTAPLVPVLNWLQIPEATAVAPGLVIGLLDQFVPAIIATSIETPLAKFVLAGLSVTQLIFFAESALLITRSPIPLSVGQLIAIFGIRTVIALPLLALIGHQIFPGNHPG